MTKNFSRTTLNLSEYTREKVRERANVHPISWVIDRDMGRYYSLMDELKGAVRKQFSKKELERLTEVLPKMTKMHRSSNLEICELILAQAAPSLDKALVKKIKGLTPADLFCLFDSLEM